MKEITITVKNPTGLHTRPGTEFVQRAKAVQSDIFIRKGEKEANSKSIIKVMRIGISCGDMITLTASGEDEEQAVQALAAYIDALKE